ncbi:MAG: hypothetical protein QOK66_06750, partial [Nitrososphaeraceae archaeon]|nr:hypothetical protein [Nitrososphaeraceae archaeon]
MSTTVTEYVCPDCGTLLRHSNPTTLESMRDVHNQLCIVKRQKTMAAQVAAPKPAAAAASVTTAKTPAAAPAAPPAAIPAATIAPAPAAGGGGGPTTISLTGTGTSYSTAEGPIDPKFKEKRQVVGTY